MFVKEKFLHFGYVGWLIFVSHLFFSFGLSTEGLLNVLTFLFMHWMISSVRSEADGASDLGIGLLMYPTMILNSLVWSFLIVIFVRLFAHVIQRRRYEIKVD